ncbi:MAG: hypothetical protein AB3X44_05515 [Leptothrix sp. (in: b-proteobacteria)]
MENHTLLKRYVFMMLVFCSTSFGAEPDDPVEFIRNQTKTEFSIFGQGFAEALRGSGTSGIVNDLEFTHKWQESSQYFKIKWVSKKKTPASPFPEYMIISKNGSVLYHDMIIIGSSTSEQLVQILGEPNSRKASKFIYELPGYTGPDMAHFSFKNNKLSTVEWFWPID